MGAPAGLHHIVHAVRDLDAAADFYRRAGFTHGSRNRHTWGTHNHVVQLQGFYVEILTVAEPEKLGDDGLGLHFGRFNQERIAGGDGFSMLLRHSVDIEADAAAFAQSGIGTAGPLSFTRNAMLADGTAATLGFSLAFARAPSSPRVGFAACQESNPALFWNEAFQRHDNGATALGGVVLTAEDPSSFRTFLTAFTGVSGVQATATGIAASTPRGRIDIMSEIGFSESYGVRAAPLGQGLRLAGLRMVVKDLDALGPLLERHAIAGTRRVGRIVIGPEQAFGATLIFETKGTET